MNKVDKMRNIDIGGIEDWISELQAAFSPIDIHKKLTICRVSCETLVGLEDFNMKLVDLLAESIRSSTSECVSISRPRHRFHLSNTLRALKNFVRLIGNTGAQADSLGTGRRIGFFEVACEELRLAGHELGSIVGAIDVEEILDSIFAEFCIGK